MTPPPEAPPPAVLHLVWNLIRGGTEGQCARVALQLAREGWRQSVSVFERHGYFLDDVETACGPVWPLPIRSIKHPATYTRVWNLSRRIRRERIDMVHCWDADAALFGSLAARWAGVPLITSRRDLGEIYPAWKCRWMDAADRRAVAVVANADAIRDRLVARGLQSDRIEVIPNILDIDQFDQQSHATFALPKDAIWIGMVARLDPEKDVGTVLRAAAQVAELEPRVRWALAGDGQERSALEALAAELGIQDRVLFLGDITEVPAFLQHCRVGVLTPSGNEGLSNTILEYMAARLPVVATDCGGNKELVREGETGHVVPIGDTKALADAVVALVRQPETVQQYGANGRRVIESTHRPEQVAARFAALYRANAVRASR